MYCLKAARGRRGDYRARSTSQDGFGQIKYRPTPNPPPSSPKSYLTCNSGHCEDTLRCRSLTLTGCTPVFGFCVQPRQIREGWEMAWSLFQRRPKPPASSTLTPAIDISRCQEIEGRERAFGGTPDLPPPQTARRPKKCKFPLDRKSPIRVNALRCLQGGRAAPASNQRPALIAATSTAL